MKQINKSNLLLISSAILVVASLPFLNFGSFSSALNIWSDVLNIISTGDRHVTRLYELTLSPNGEWTWVVLNINPLKDQLNISNGLVVWNENSSSEWQFSSIWWWMTNSIEDSNYAWIAWWTNGKISLWHNSVIWGWNWNTINGQNAIIAWWDGNSATEFWVIVWWSSNKSAKNGVALWGQNNSGGENSLVMWSGSKWKNAFARNAKTIDNSARIDAKSGVLIGTTESIPWVSLVVNWAIKINWDRSDRSNWVAWEIRVVDGCFYAFDWQYRHVISQTNNSEECTWFATTETCIFGNVRLQQWDQVTWYNATISTSCVGERVVCSGGALLTVAWNTEGYNSPYCYETTN